jgi:class 3 adenylate cyclase
MRLWGDPRLLKQNLNKAYPSWLYHLRAQVPPLIMLLLALLLPDPAGYDATKYTTFVYDGSNTGKFQSLTDIMQQSADHWRAVSGGHHHGLRTSTGVMWYRIQVPKSSSTESLVAEVGYHMMRKADFYLTDGPRLLSSVSQGMQRPQVAGDGYPRLSFAADPSKDLMLYLRIEADVEIIAPIFIGIDSDYRMLSLFRRSLHGVMIGIVLGFVLYNFGLFLTLRQPMYAFFLLAQLMSAAFAFLFSGQLGIFWPGIHENLTLHTNFLCSSVLLTQLFLLIFDHYYLARNKRAGRNEWIEKSLILMTIVILIAIPLSSPSIASIFIVGTLNSVCFSVLIYRARKLPIRGVFYYYNFYYGVISGVLIGVSSWLGLIEGSFFSHYMSNGALIWGVLAMSAALSRRILDLEDDHKNIAKSLFNKRSGPVASQLADLSQGAVSQTREIDVSIMFIDIVSFSLLADQNDREDLFSDLSGRLASLTKIIESFDGVVDRSLGDGMLCFFSDKGGSVGGKDHAHAAFSAAKAIQELILIDTIEDGNSRNSSRRKLSLPVRIGIHSDNVLLGNIGTHMRVDFTIVGKGVHFASSLERTCGPFHVMISASCYERLMRYGAEDVGFSPVHFGLRYQHDLVQAFEFNPFHSRPSELKQAMSLYFNQLGMQSRYNRIPAVTNSLVELKSAGGVFRVLDFSLHGFRVVSDIYIAQRSVLEFTIDMQRPELNELLYSKRLESITAEVRWSRKSESGFEHGLKILGGNTKQLELLFNLFVNQTYNSQNAVFTA